jgi:hypothetical protein
MLSGKALIDKAALAVCPAHSRLAMVRVVMLQLNAWMVVIYLIAW